MSDIALIPESTDKTRRSTEVWLGISQLIAVIVFVGPILVIVWYLVAYPQISSEIFAEITLADPNTILQALIVAGVLLIGPLVTIICAVIAWRSYNSGLYRHQL